MKAGSKTKIYEDIEQVKVKKVENGFDHGVDLPVKLPLMPLTTDLDQFEPIDEKKAKEGRSNIPAKDEGQRQSVPAKDLQEQDEKEKKRLEKEEKERKSKPLSKRLKEKQMAAVYLQKPIDERSRSRKKSRAGSVHSQRKSQ